MNFVGLAEYGRVPDPVLRWGMRRLLAARRRQEGRRHGADADAAVDAFAERLRTAPVAVDTEAANAQHYEVPSAFFEAILGPRLKYSSCLFEDARSSLAEAEEAMLRLTAERAGLADGQRVLELGCGWGSFCLWAAERFPASRITAVSNSRTQREFIEV